MTMIETQPRLPQLVDDVTPPSRTAAPGSPPSPPEAKTPTARDQQPKLPQLVDDGPRPQAAPATADPDPVALAANDPRVAAYVLDLPQNYTPDAEQLGRFKVLAVKHGLAPQVATELVGFHAEVLRGEEAAIEQEVAGWRAASEKLPEMQGDGRQAVAHAAALADRQTKAWLDSTGLGSHPEFIRWAARVGRELYRLQGGGSGPTPSQRQQPRLPYLNP